MRAPPGISIGPSRTRAAGDLVKEWVAGSGLGRAKKWWPDSPFGSRIAAWSARSPALGGPRAAAGGTGAVGSWEAIRRTR